MSSFVYFKFKSQKEPTRVTINGPHTDVWNLKREIITLSRLGDGTDFDLKIYKDGSEEEYIDDTEIIPKDSTVLARRLPASAPGKGRAARYVSGKPPATAKPTSSVARVSAAAMLDNNMSEEDRIKAMLKMTDAQWQAQQEDMSHEARINIAGQSNIRKNVKIPEGEPPNGYVCYRCKKKGHWIQACPTNDDASYDGRPRTKRTTGIPQSRLRKVDESEIDNLDEISKQNLMVNADGDYVLAQADEKAWSKFQEQQQANGEAQRTARSGDKELQERGLLCPLNKQMFVDPMKTPCCGTTYCLECIENALIDNDLTCPGCQTPNISLEGLTPDEAAKQRIKEYESESKGARSATASVVGSPHLPNSSPLNRASTSPKSPSSVAGRKRGASDLSVSGIAAKRQKSAEPQSEQTDDEQASTSAQNGINTPNMMPSLPMMPMMNGMPMPMPMAMPMFNPMMMNPMMMQQMMGMNGMNMMPNMNGYPMMNGYQNSQAGNFGTYQSNGFSDRGRGRGNGWKPKNQAFSKPTVPPAEVEGAPKGPKAMSNAPTAPAAMKTGSVPTGPSRGSKPGAKPAG